jgi:hypothetical protein
MDVKNYYTMQATKSEFNNVADIGINRNIILKWIIEEYDMDWIQLTQENKEGNLLTSFQDGLCSKKTKQTPWPLVRERTIPTERPPLVDEI